MALSKTTVPRQAPRPRPTAPLTRAEQLAASLEDDGFPEVEESTPVPPVSHTPRITVDGIPCRRLQLDFGKDYTGYNPTGSVMERYWDQYDDGADKDKNSRPRVFGNAIIKVTTTNGFLDFVASWPGSPGITKIVQANANLNYEPA